MGRRQSAPRCQNTLEHGILSDVSLFVSSHQPTRPFDFTFVSIPTCCKIEACIVHYTSNGVTTGANLSRPQSAVLNLTTQFPLTHSLLLSLFSFSHLSFSVGLSTIFARRLGKGRSFSWPYHLRIFSEGHIAFLDRFHCFFSLTPY